MVSSSVRCGPLNIRRIEAGILDSGSDFDKNPVTPVTLASTEFVDRMNEKFIGPGTCPWQHPGANRPVRAAHARVWPSRQVTEVYSGGKKVAYVTTAARSPHFDAAIGYARFDTKGDWVRQDLLVRSIHGKDAPCEILSLPFYDKAKRLPRDFPPPRLKRE